MVYLDYSATTPPDEEVLSSFVNASKKYIGNPNSLHLLGIESRKLIDKCTDQISKILNIKPNEIIYTSSSTEANNLAIKGIALKYRNRGKKIITTKFEHSSIYGPLTFLAKEYDFTIEFVNTDSNGVVDLKHLESLLTDDTILVSITAVNSEIGIIEPIDEIASIIKKHPKCFFHVDLTQIIGKKEIDLKNIDLASFSAHKFYGLKGIGVLIKKETINLEPVIHGGKSTTIYRAGTPALPLIVSISKALRLASSNLKEKYEYVTTIKKHLIEGLSKYQDVYINSNDKCIPHIVNISFPKMKPETLLHSLEEDEIYISTKTACSIDNSPSMAVLSLTNDKEKASSSVRISLSYKTTKEEIDIFLNSFDKIYKKVVNLNENNKN